MSKSIKKGGSSMYCPKCGNKISDDALFCSGCGAAMQQTDAQENTNPEAYPEFTEEWYQQHPWVLRVQPEVPLTREEKEKLQNELKAKILGSFVGMLICLIACLYALITYTNDTSQWLGYNYKSPLTSHELLVVIFGICGAAGLLVDAIVILSTIKKLQKLNGIKL